MDLVYFVYGLSFVVMGLTIVNRYDRDSRLGLAGLFWLLAAFGFVHGFREWMDLWRVVRGDSPGQAAARPWVLLVSFLFLFEFGRRLTRLSLPPGSAVRPLLGPYLYVPILAGIAANGNLDVSSRLLLALPGGALAGLGFWRTGRQLGLSKLTAAEGAWVKRGFRAAGLAFLAYGLFGGLVTPGWSESFADLFRVPIQVPRAVCAVLAAVAVGFLLKVFHLEGVQRLRASERRLRQSEERFRSLVEGTTDWAWETDYNHAFSWVSPSFETAAGVSDAVVMGKRRWDLASPERDIDASLWLAHMEDLGAHRPFRDFRYWIRRDDGEVRWISVDGSPRFDQDGTFLGYRGSGSDVTAEASGAMRLKMLSTVVEQSPVSVVITDPAGAIEYVNTHLTRASGYEAAEMIGANARLFASGETPAEIYQEMWETITEGRRWVGELRNRRKDGELRWETIVIAPVLDDVGAIAHYVAIKADVTESRLMRDQLRQTNAELEQFAYVASHDLRQPLRMVGSYLNLIEKRIGPHLSDDIKQYLDFATGGAKQMDRLILDLLEYSRTGRTKSMVAVPLAEAVARARLNLTVAIREVDADIVVADTLPTVSGDATELARLFQNLIGNAVKYRAPERRPRVEVDCRRQGREWVVSVKDNGIGIDPQHHDRAFGIFQRLVAPAAYEGTGIGLAVCKKIVEHHGGRIWIDSALDQGCTFFVALPVAERHANGRAVLESV